MKKRGLYITGGGVAMIVISFAVATSIINESGAVGGQFSLPDLLEGMFDEVSDEAQIGPGESYSFSFDASTNTQELLWGIQILDYEGGDVAEITISNIYGDEFGKFRLNQPAMFETMKIEKSDIYNFNVKNTGTRQITTVMMFTKNPEESERLVDPNSPVSKTLVPLAISGILLFVGIAAAIVGAIIMIVDYRKKQSELI
ncbi:MAG TPA: hypothetical protein VNK44_03410 [Candidatus Nitrosotenuis sp.]|nr:hypothetical protein [Candidatus Nitrosotenuis sp.]